MAFHTAIITMTHTQIVCQVVGVLLYRVPAAIHKHTVLAQFNVSTVTDYWEQCGSLSGGATGCHVG